MGEEAAAVASPFEVWFFESLSQTPIKALDHSVGLRMKGFCQTMFDVVSFADTVKGVLP
jgi:hypothetical protein